MAPCVNLRRLRQVGVSIWLDTLSGDSSTTAASPN
jgi:hypothetical protein